MGLITPRSILSETKVREAMRRQVVRLPMDATFKKAITHFVKYKVNAVLVTELGTGESAGVVSKTDIMGAYYAGLSLDTPLGDVMSSPPLYCRPDDSLETALETMKTAGVYRIYVTDGKDVAGVLAYPDIVGLLYQFCYECAFSRHRRKPSDAVDPALRYRVREVMTQSVKSFPEEATLMEVMEGLSVFRLGAVLITDPTGRGAGVVSKSDLVTAFLHGTDPMVAAKTVMTAPVVSCNADDFLEIALRRLIFMQIQRIFVHSGDPGEIAGVLSLSDAARIRSGSCQACTTTRIRVES